MVVKRLQPFAETIFATMTARAVEYGAINLGQGFPDSDGPDRMLEIAQQEIAGGNNQYGPGMGMQVLRDAVAAYRGVDADNVLITVGATEGIAATVLGLVEPGSEVIVLEPYYDSYAAAIALANATRIAVPLKEVGRTWDVDVEAVRAAITNKTSMIVVNSPHNPTGSVFSRESLEELARLAIEHDLYVLSDEVYENLRYGDARHTRLAELPGMWERTVTVSSAAKSFNATGWKTGWAIAPTELLDGVVKAKQFMSYVGATPFQPAVAHALNEESEWLSGMVAGLDQCREILARGLKDAGFDVYDTHGTYFIVVDIATMGYASGIDFCMDLPELAGVAAIPVEVFTDHPEQWTTKVRFAFCKKPEVITGAVNRLKIFAEQRSI